MQIVEISKSNNFCICSLLALYNYRVDRELNLCYLSISQQIAFDYNQIGAISPVKETDSKIRNTELIYICGSLIGSKFGSTGKMM